MEETIKGLKPADSVRAGLGKGWLKIAELAQAEGDAPAVEAAIARVIVHGEALARGDDPVSGVRGQHSMLSKAAQIAEEMKLPIFKPLLMDLIKLLKLKRRLQGDKGTLSSLAYWTGIAADHAEADAEKIALYGDAIALREALLEQEPKGRADLLRLMNRVAVFHGRAGRFKEGRALYEAAVALTEGQGDAEIKGLRLFILGNLAQLLGKNKAIKDAKRHAKAAYDLGRALRLSQPKDEKIQLRAAVAGLRHARLLRAAPQPKPKDALKIAREIKAEVDAFTFESPRLKGLREGLDALLKELR